MGYIGLSHLLDISDQYQFQKKTSDANFAIVHDMGHKMKVIGKHEIMPTFTSNIFNDIRSKLFSWK
jgi:hypothetical protein